MNIIIIITLEIKFGMVTYFLFLKIKYEFKKELPHVNPIYFLLLLLRDYEY